MRLVQALQDPRRAGGRAGRPRAVASVAHQHEPQVGVAVAAVTSQKLHENVVWLLGWLVNKKKLARPTLNAFDSAQIGVAVQLYIILLVDEEAAQVLVHRRLSFT